MIEFFIKRPVTTIMFVSVFVVLGIFSYFNLKLDKQPKVDFPIVTVSVVYPGSTSLEMETAITNKLEDAISELSEVKKIRSYSYDNFGYVFVEFQLSSEINTKLIEVKDKIDSLLNTFPEGMKKPVIAKFNPFLEPVVNLALSSQALSAKELYELADGILKDQILAIKGVANLELFGGEQRQINVSLDPALMREHYVALEDVLATIKMKNKNLPGGLLENGKQAFNLRFIGEYARVQDIENTLIMTRNGESLPLKTIATVEDSVKKTEKIARFNGKSVVGISIKKASDSNAVEIARHIHKNLAKFQKSLPKNTTLEIANDTTQVIVSENYKTLWTILEGILLTIAILYLFTGSFKLTFVSAIAIPISLVSAFFLMDLSKFSINFLTLLAIASSIGTLVANAIVIIENFWKHLSEGKNAFDAAVVGTKEVSVAILASTGTNLVVFAPIVFMGGMVGMFMTSFGLTVIYVTLFSLLVSFALTPMLCYTILKKQENSSGRMVRLVNSIMQFFLSKYKTVFEDTFRYPKTICLLIILGIFSIRFLTPYIPSNFMPASDKNSLSIEIALPQGSLLEKTLQTTKTIEQKIARLPEVQSYFSLVGKSGPENASVTVNLLPVEKRKKSDVKIIEELVPFFSKILDAEITINRGDRKGFDSGDITLNIKGSNYDQMIGFMQQMKEKMIDTGYFRNISSTYKIPKKEIRFIPDQKRLMEYGLKELQVGSLIYSAVYGDRSNIFKNNGKEYDILIRLDEKYVKEYSDLQYVDVISKKGLLPILKIGTLKEQKAVPMLEHENKKRVLKLNGFLAKSDPGHVTGVLQKAFSEIPKNSDADYTFAGMAEMQEESSIEIIKAFLLAVILTYMLLAAIMNSLVRPLAIIISVATSFIGVYFTLFFLEESINISSMLGMIMLVGLIVNNSILLLDDAIQKIEQKMPLKEALWSAASEKFRVILMTSLAIILGVLPQLWDIMPVKSSMGAVMLGGMVGSLLFCFLFTPVAFYYIEKLRIKFTKRPEKT
ncbi:MAG: efflux RND transporter permease subunit [Parachlamydiales bacterium]|jgi:HAE1 family hydrophobic/amphiphilic exporter-1